MEGTIQPVQSPLEHRFVGTLRGTFFVPSYQRGYRWDTGDVQRLLDDIWASRGNDYSLQPVVVKKYAKEGNDEQGQQWELIDGQQRLTTLYLIFLYMQKRGWKKNGGPYSISYQTRPDSAIYLRTLDESVRKTNIDYFHLYQAYEHIDQWFCAHGDEFEQENAANKFHGCLSNSVRVIWYEAPADMDSTALFTRLNMGRIPLTDAELIKALLLSHARESSTDHAQEVAAQWDGIERDLRHPDVWAFVAGADASDDGNKYPTRISLLLDTLAPLPKDHPPGRNRPRYHTFESLREHIKSPHHDFWNQVQGLHALILGWYGNPILYNKIGFLVATGAPFGDLVELAKGQKKSAFENILDDHIRCSLDIGASELLDLSYQNKHQYVKISKILLLMNVEASSQAGLRFPFRLHVGRSWSLEHIHAQNAESLTTSDQWTAWLVAHKKALNAIPGQTELLQRIDAALNGLDTSRNFGTTFKDLAADVLTVFNAPTSGVAASNHDVHSISNLALLSREDNSELNNAVFEVKRQIVLEIDRKGGYIPICTRNIFLKYYADADALQIHFWSPQDKESYFKAIVCTLKDYLQREEPTS
jgi:hypothetical protein